MILLQAISIIFGLFMLYVVRIHWTKAHLKPFESGMWISVWLLFIFLSAFPQTVGGIAQSLHIVRIFDLLVIGSLMVIIYVTFLNRVAYKKLEKKLESIIRKNAIDETSNSSKS